MPSRLIGLTGRSSRRQHWPAFGVFMAIAASAGAVEPPAKNVPFTDARRELIAAGWKPRETFLLMGGGERANQWGDAEELYRAGFIEVVACSGTGRNYCSFNYVRGKACLVLHTLGEFSPGKYEPFVFRRSSECPSKEELGVGRPAARKQNAP